MIQKEMSLKDIAHLELWKPFRSVEQNHLCNFRRGYNEERFCEIILNLGQWFASGAEPFTQFCKRASWESSCDDI